MQRNNPRHPQYSSSESEDEDHDYSDKAEDESQFHTFAARKSANYQNNMKHSNSQEQEQEEEDQQQNSEEQSYHQSHSQESNENQNTQNQQSIEMIEARIRKLQNQLSSKLKKISPQRQLQRAQDSQNKKLLMKPKYLQSSIKPHSKEDSKKQSISPKYKKSKSKEKCHSSNPHLVNKNQLLKRSVQSNKVKTIESNKGTKTNSRKAAQELQRGSLKQVYNKHEFQQSKRQNQQPKNKAQSKSKKRSCLEKDIEDMDYLKSKIGSPDMTKLEKQIQLLKILQSIRGKLKKSINHKLLKLYPDNDRNSNKSKISTFLLHRGCPANYLN